MMLSRQSSSPVPMLQTLIRVELPTDFEAIRRVHESAFGQPAEARLVDELRREGYSRVSLVADHRGLIIGHILFSEMQIDTATESVPALSLAPLAVDPQYQRQGIGSQLIRHGLDLCRDHGHNIVILLGHPEYYTRFGFSASLAMSLDSPFNGESWMALELVPGALRGICGRVRYPPPFNSLS